MAVEEPTIATLEQLADAQLVAHARNGNARAIEQLVQRYHGTVWAIAYARLRDHHAADDLAQEVFLVSWLHLDKLTDASRYAAWISQITHHRAVDFLRSKHQRSRLLGMVREYLRPQSGSCSDEAWATGRAEAHEAHELLQDAILALPEQQRIIVMLRYGQDLNLEQISQRLDVHPTTVGRILEKGLARLRRQLYTLDDAALERDVRPAVRGRSKASSATAAALTVAVAALPWSQQQALASASGNVPSLAASGHAALALTSGVKIMAGIKIAAVTTAFAGLVGMAVYAATPATPPATAPSAAAVSADVPATDEEKVIRAVRKECFPKDVCDFLLDRVPQLALELDPQKQLPVTTLYHSVDHEGVPWLALVTHGRNTNGGVIRLGGTSTKGPSGIISDTEGYAPVIRTGNGSPQQAQATITEPWPPDQDKRFVAITRWDKEAIPLQPNPQGHYPLRLYNQYGRECIQQIVLVLPPGWSLADNNVDIPTETYEVGANTILVWQNHVLSGRDGYGVMVYLDRVKEIRIGVEPQGIP